MLPRELHALGEAVRKDVAAEEQKAGRPIIHNFREELPAAESGTNTRVVPPFAVMGSLDMDPSVGPVWPIREYAW
jgi:hypothetical protein